jgi:hypothetical protein
MRTTRMNLKNRVLLVIGSCFVAGVLSVSPGFAGVDFGARTGPYTEENQPFIGGEVLFDMGTHKKWFGNPNAEYVFVDSGNLTAVSFDVHYDFAVDAPLSVWAGAGPTVIFRDRDRPGNDDSTDAGANLLFGIGAKTGEFRPYGQVKVVLADNSEAVLGVGVRF